MAEAGTAESFLKAQKAHVSGPLRMTIGAGTCIGGVVIVQAWLIARIVSAVLFDGASLADMTLELVALPVVFFARAGLIYVSEIASFEAASEVKRRLRDELLQHVSRLGPIRLAGHKTGTLVSTITDSVEAIHPYYARYLPAVTLTAILPLAILIVVFPADWLSALVFVLTAPMIPLFMILIGKGAEAKNQRQWSTLMRMSGHLLDAIKGLPTLKLFNASRREAEIVSAMAEGYRRDTMAVLRVAFLSSLALEFFATVSIAMIAVLIGFRLLWGEMTFFSGFFVLLLAPEFYAPLRSLGAHYHARMEAIGAVDKIVALLALSADNEPPIEPVQVKSWGAPRIQFENITIEFEDGRRGLDDISFVIEPGERVALVGPSGAGKTTVLNLLLGFVTPSSGRILINGRPMQEYDIADWRRHISWTPQRPHIFGMSVGDNIAMAESHDVATDTNGVMAVVREASAEALIERLPHGLATIPAENGADLSGGEVQRIALARAFHRQPVLVLMDEPTAHLDPVTERGILSATERLLNGRTSITAAHRLETVKRADRIFVLKKGRLVEQGKHAALMKTGGLYCDLVRRAAAED
ncbi:MAG: thiol reductant ABC exporter subunit CydD [Hyphomicrobiaceae bacterium]